MLLISSSPRDEYFVRPNLSPERDRDREPRDRERDPNASPESISRRRAVNWLDEDFTISSQQTSPRRAGWYGGTNSGVTSREASRIRVDSHPGALGRAGTDTDASTSVGSSGFSRSRSRGRDRSESSVDPFR